MRKLLTLFAAVVACSSPPQPVAHPHARQQPALPAAPQGPVLPSLPVARTADVVDHAFGIEVHDPYRWMETGGDELATWLRGQGAFTAAVLATLPNRAALGARIHDLASGVTAVFDVRIAAGRTFYKQLGAGEQLAKLYVRDTAGDRVLVDPEQLSASDPSKGHAALEAYSVAPDGGHVAYVISRGGGEVGVLHVLDVATGAELSDAIERIWGEGAAAWLPDGKRFFYTQLAVPTAGVDPMLGMVARLHRLGDPVDRDVTILGRDAGTSLPLAPEEWPGLWASSDGNWAVAQIGGAHNEVRIAVARIATLDLTGASKTPWRIVAGYPDGVESAEVHGDRLYVLTFAGAPNRKLVSVPLANPNLAHARIEIAEDPAATLHDTWNAHDGLYVLSLAEGRARLRRLAWGGKTPVEVALPEPGWVPDGAVDPHRDGLTFQLETWLAPGRYYTTAGDPTKVAPIHLASSSPADFSAIAVDDVEAPSADGTQVPLTIIHRKDLALDGARPTLVDAYGAYGVAALPGFSATRLAWLERDGVIAVAHVRGGGERGRKWQDDGSREHKLNGVHDFIACAEYLVAHHYTNATKLAAHGASMGGVLIGRVLTERPDLFAAVSIGVGIVNPLRILAADNGANQKAELGDPETEAGYRSILEMDPYQHVKPAEYPAVLFTIGLNDHRVAPWMTAKLAARLDAVKTGFKPIMIRLDADAGHGIGSTRDQAIAERTDVWSFFLAVLTVGGVD